MSKRHFFPILGTLQTGGGGRMLLETLMSDPDSGQKASPLLKDFWCFLGPGVGGSAVWGAPHHRALVVWDARRASHSCGAGGAELPYLHQFRPISHSGAIRCLDVHHVQLRQPWRFTACRCFQFRITSTRD